MSGGHTVATLLRHLLRNPKSVTVPKNKSLGLHIKARPHWQQIVAENGNKL